MATMETLRRVIQPHECDILGHMNVARYFDCCSDAGFAIMAACGLDRNNVLGGKRQSFAVVHSDATFHAEVLVGEAVYMKTCVADMGRRSATFHHRLFRATDDKLVFETKFRVVLMDLEKRKAVVIDDTLRAALAGYTCEEGEDAAEG